MIKQKKMNIILSLLLVIVVISSCSKDNTGVKYGKYVCNNKGVAVEIYDDATGIFIVSDVESFEKNCKLGLLNVCDRFCDSEEALEMNQEKINSLSLGDYLNRNLSIRIEDYVEYEGCYYIYFPEFYELSNDEVSISYSITLLYYPSTSEMTMDGVFFNEEGKKFVFVLSE